MTLALQQIAAYRHILTLSLAGRIVLARRKIFQSILQTLANLDTVLWENLPPHLLHTGQVSFKACSNRVDNYTIPMVSFTSTHIIDLTRTVIKSVLWPEQT